MKISTLPQQSKAEKLGILLDEADMKIFKNRGLHVRYLRGTIRHVALKWKGATITLGRAILEPSADMEVDHINCNPLDNRRENLRIVTPSENNQNKRKHKGTSNYKGVHWDKYRCKWYAEIKLNRQKTYIGRFDNEINAALAYDSHVRRLFVSHGRYNFPNNNERAA